MKKIFLTLTATIFLFAANGQGLYDALRYSDYGIGGTARYMSMAGSFGALGGDASAALDNPAALGIFRSSEISLSLSLTPTSSYAAWKGENSRANATYFGINNLSWVFNIPTNSESGYLASNLSFGYQKIKNFNRKTYIKSGVQQSVSLSNFIADYTEDLSESALQNNDAYGDDNIGWLSILGYDAGLISPYIDPEHPEENLWQSNLGARERVIPYYASEERGGIDEYNFSYSGNFNDKFYIGAGLSLQSFSYSWKSTYYEDFANGGSLSLENLFVSSGIGINLKAGAIVRPAKFLRLGISFVSPTYCTMTENLPQAKMQSAFEPSVTAKTPENYRYSYSFQTPLRVQASVGLVFGKISAINVDYQFSNQKSAHFSGQSNKDFLLENKDIKNFAKNVHAIKAGIEFRLGNYVKLRGGFAYATAPVKENAPKILPYNSIRTDMEFFAFKQSIYGSAGIGFYLGKNINLDLAYVYNANYQEFMPFYYADKEIKKALKSEIKTVKNNIVATFAIRY
ncbi:MAG: hypothetical protein LBS50_08500 [Prevotellaceae bacterium]|jgi:hypothetical protein|nr:hypothetical protein [Prevotellaceae bacterium]